MLSATYQLPFNGQRLDARLADRHDRPVAERQPGQHRDQQRDLERRGQHGAAGSRRADPHHRLGRPVVRSGVVRGGSSLRQSRTQRGDRAGISQHRSLGQEAPDDGTLPAAAAGGRVRSVQPPELRPARATSSAARPSARSPAPVCRPARPVRRARFSWWRSCRSDARSRLRARGVSSRPSSSRASRASPRVVAQAPDQARADHSRRPARLPGKRGLRRGDAADAVLASDDRRSRRTRSTWRTRSSRRRRTSALADSIRIKFRDRPLDLVIANTAPALQFVLQPSRRTVSGPAPRLCRRDASPDRAAGQRSPV